MSDSVWSHRRQPTRLPHPWDSPGKNTGVGCHFLLQYMKVKSESEVAQSCTTLCDPMDYSLPGSSIHGIFQARVLEWVAIAFSTKWLCYLQIEDSFNPSFPIYILLKVFSCLFSPAWTSRIIMNRSGENRHSCFWPWWKSIQSFTIKDDAGHMLFKNNLYQTEELLFLVLWEFYEEWMWLSNTFPIFKR